MVSNSFGMKDQTNSNVARDGSPKRPQTSFPIAIGMKDQVKSLSGISPANPGVGPDAAPANPLSPEPGMKELHRQPGDLKASWGMRDANGNSINGVQGKAVLAEATRLGK